MNANACRRPISLFRVACKRGKLVLFSFSFSLIPNRKEIPFYLFHDDKEKTNCNVCQEGWNMASSISNPEPFKILHTYVTHLNATTKVLKKQTKK
jgi:hypothetical protein